jgi:hypothetical protein
MWMHINSCFRLEVASIDPVPFIGASSVRIILLLSTVLQRAGRVLLFHNMQFPFINFRDSHRKRNPEIQISNFEEENMTDQPLKHHFPD